MIFAISRYYNVVIFTKLTSPSGEKEAGKECHFEAKNMQEIMTKTLFNLSKMEKTLDIAGMYWIHKIKISFLGYSTSKILKIKLIKLSDDKTTKADIDKKIKSVLLDTGKKHT